MSHEIQIPDGVWPTMVTPFLENREIDWDGLDALVDWYIDGGVAGLFAVCLSSEMFDLSPDEGVQLAARVVERSAGRVPVVSAGAFGVSIDEQAAMVRRLSETGVAAVVLTTNQLVGEDADDTDWRSAVERLMASTGNIPLGIYECPKPFPRLLSPDTMKWLSGTGRFYFFKDTCCDPVQLEAKINAVRGTPLRLFNANAQTLLGSLRAGANGYCSIDANFYPELYVRLCSDFTADPEAAEVLQAFLSVGNMTTRNKYPLSAKKFLALRGLPIRPVCRIKTQEFIPQEEAVLKHLLRLALDEIEQRSDS